MWNVNLYLIDYAYGQDKDLARQLWQSFWNDGLEYDRRYVRFNEKETEEYICRLICCYFVYFIKDGGNGSVDEEREELRIAPPRPFGKGTEKQREIDNLMDGWLDGLMVFFHQIKEMPVVILYSIIYLLENGLRWEAVIGGCNGDFFRCEFKRAAEIAEGQKIYEWVGRFLKKKGFS